MGICPKILSIEEAEKIETARRSLEAHAERMRLRDKFAAAALTGLLCGTRDGQPFNESSYAKLAYRCADAMLAAMEQKP